MWNQLEYGYKRATGEEEKYMDGIVGRKPARDEAIYLAVKNTVDPK